MKVYELRPLGIGEILDRAASLLVSRFASLVLILFLMSAPLAIVQFLAQPDMATLLDGVQRLASAPAGSAQRDAILRQIGQASGLSGWVAATVAISLLLAPLGSTACVMALNEAYRGRQISVRAIYARAVRRWSAQIGLGVLFLGVVAVAIIAASLLLAIVAIAIGAASGVSRAIGAVAGIPLGLAALVLVLAAYALVYLAYQLAFVSIALDDPHPVRALGRSLQQTFARVLFWRSLSIAAILVLAQTIGIYLSIALAAGLAVLTHLTPLYPVVVTTCNVVLTAFFAAYSVVYAIDVRVRREGNDPAAVAARTY